MYVTLAYIFNVEWTGSLSYYKLFM